MEIVESQIHQVGNINEACERVKVYGYVLSDGRFDISVDVVRDSEFQTFGAIQL